MNQIPDDFKRLIDSYNAPALSELTGALLTEPSVSVRFNTAKGAIVPEGYERVPWCADGIYLPERVPFAFDPAWHQGLFYVQDASSMFAAHAVGVIAGILERPVRLLDACAAPGGKTTAAISALPAGSTVVANEYVPARCAVLRENLAKWGFGDIAVTQGDTARFRDLPGAFDIIMADVPCSGEGMMRKEPEAAAQWSMQLVEQCAARQREILDNLWPALAPGGYLIYSTCTFNRVENEEMVSHIVDRYGAESIQLPIDPAWGIEQGIDTPHHCYRFIPGRVRGEGLFMAVLRKPADASDAGPVRQKKRKDSAKPQKIADEVKRWLNTEASWRIEGDTVIALPTDAHPIAATLGAGLPVAVIKGRDMLPTQQLAMSRMLRPEAFYCVEVDPATAVSYLSCNAITLPNGSPRGIVLLTYCGRPLGFAKNLGSRANNLYPKAWRIVTPGATPFIFHKS